LINLPFEIKDIKAHGMEGNLRTEAAELGSEPRVYLSLGPHALSITPVDSALCRKLVWSKDSE